MSKKKGLSVDEKRVKLLEIFHENKTFYQLKDLEKIAPKEKGIVVQSVKEILQQLVDDGLVDAEKIGTSNYFWSFPSKVYRKRKAKVAELEDKIESAKQRKTALDGEIAALTDGREDTAEREKLLNEVQAAEEKQRGLAAELSQYNECNPEVIEKKKELTKLSVEAANRWTDNVFAIRSWTAKKFNQDAKDLNKAFQIPDDFDYIET